MGDMEQTQERYEREQKRRESRDRENALQAAASALAEYMFAYGEDRHLTSDLEYVIQQYLEEKRAEAAKEHALDAKAAEMGYKY